MEADVPRSPPAPVRTDGVTLGDSPNLFRWKPLDKAHVHLGLSLRGEVMGIADSDSGKERGHPAGASSVPTGKPGSLWGPHTAGQTAALPWVSDPVPPSSCTFPVPGHNRTPLSCWASN